MAMPVFSMKELLESGAHFGHRTGRWNPKMAPYIYGARNGIHVLDLRQTVPMLYAALGAVRNAVAAGGKVLFVGTKEQAQDIIRESAERCGQYYMNHRWLGGSLTNWKTINNSIKELKSLEEMFANPELQTRLTKKERLMKEREFQKLQRALGGIKEMGGLPDIIVVVDVNKERLAVAEANVLGIPVVGIVDSNSNPDGIEFLVPGNDDATRSISLYCRLFSDAVLDGMAAQVARSEVSDKGARGRKTVVKLSSKASQAAQSEEGASAAEAAAEAVVTAEMAAAAEVAAVAAN